MQCCWNDGHKELLGQIAEKDTALTNADAYIAELTARLLGCDAGQSIPKLPFVPSQSPDRKPQWIREAFSAIPSYPGGVDWKQMDNLYNPATDEEIIAFIEWDNTESLPYGPRGTCDWSAMYFAGKFKVLTRRNNVFFTVDWSGAHAYIIFVRRSGLLWIFEEQSDRKWTLASHEYGEHYPLEHLLIIG